MFDEALAQQQAVRRNLDGLANSPDPFGRVLTHALCTGMAQVKDFPEEDAPSNAEWDDFLVEEVNILAPGNPIDFIQSKVNAFVTVAQLGSIHPRAAQIYYQECLRRPR